MKLNLKVTKSKVKNHFTYGLWKYIAATALIIFGWNLIYTTSAYRTPPEKKVDLYVYAPTAVESTMEAYGAHLQQDVVPNMDEVNFVILSLSESDTYYDAQIMVYVYANEGDAYILGRDKIKSLAGSGAFLDLAPYVESGALDLTGIDTSYGMIYNEDANVTALYAIPLDSFNAMGKELAIATSGTMAAVTAYSITPDEAVACLNAMLQEFRSDNK